MFEVREPASAPFFLRNYLTKELTDELDLYIFEKKGPIGRLRIKHGRRSGITSFIRG